MSSVVSSGITFSCKLLPLSIRRILALIPLKCSRNFCRICVSSCGLPCCFFLLAALFLVPFSALQEMFLFWFNRIFAHLDDFSLCKISSLILLNSAFNFLFLCPRSVTSSAAPTYTFGAPLFACAFLCRSLLTKYSLPTNSSPTAISAIACVCLPWC